ncbi:Flagellar basal body protein [Candidatus Hydrogenisulfobacillus filiaventi]|uniref:Flagellar basal body protein n=1 Tax=Candidatus Hydrogenisulfobacillus filiaventi TaxID=2707344 RepID=A0A6F8ZED8_9FIRM|nr:Flagellar basal body protein [Candidatus Hydrogenisulfobacillus filiaventi]
MFSTLGIAASGLATAGVQLNADAVNLANLQTPGFGRQSVAVTAGAEQLVRPGTTVLAGQVLVPDLGWPQGSVVAGTAPLFGDSIRPTGVPTNLAIAGAGFFAVQAPDGGVAYTRAGDFAPDAAGQLVLPDGSRLLPPVTVPPGATVAISSQGVVTATLPSGTTRTLGRITLVQFPNPQGLEAIGGNLYRPGPDAGAPQPGRPGTGGLGTLQAGALNQSGVSLTATLGNLLEAQETYLLTARVLGVAGSLERLTAGLRA